MSAIEKIQEIGLDKPYHGLSNLSHGYHEIQAFRLVKSKYTKINDDEYGKSILIELADQIIFLPQYFLDAIGESGVEELNSSVETMYLFFGGKRQHNK